MKVSDFISQYLVDSGIEHVFTVTGGGAMHLNDSLGHQKGLKCYYQHHEQACAMAAEAYARVNNKIALVCVTTGPGGTNAITGVVGGWLDSIPMLIISGQVRYDTMARSTGLDIRSMGDQEFDITGSISNMTKYCELVIDPNRIKYCLHKALTIASNGRPGPCWLDIPLNVQGAYVETGDLVDYEDREYMGTLPMDISDNLIIDIIHRISEAERPVFYAGNGIRLSGGFKEFNDLIRRLNIPVVTNWDSIDLIPDDCPLYAGRAGSLGDRAGNFAVQNSDLIFSVGSRLSIRQTGFNWTQWAKHAYVIMEDVCADEMRKPTLHVDMPLHVDAKVLMRKMLQLIPDGLNAKKEWISRCKGWREKYPVVQPYQCIHENKANPYCFMKELSMRLPEGMITVVGNGTACAVGSHAYYIRRGQRFIVNSAIASMGYDLPAAIGACIASGRRDTVCIAGDGSIMMNLQELQTIITNHLPIKLFIINNQGYHSIRMTQTNLFGKRFVGIGEQSSDLSFPDFSKLSSAFGFSYCRIERNGEMDVIDQVLSKDGPMVCEVFVDVEQVFEPKSATKKLPDGSLYSPPLEDMAPFLPRDELESNLYYKDDLK